MATLLLPEDFSWMPPHEDAVQHAPEVHADGGHKQINLDFEMLETPKIVKTCHR
jgi:hypothetical protein